MVQGFLQIAIFCALLLAVMPLVGTYMARVFSGERVLLTPVVGGFERLTYRLLRVDPRRGQDWKSYGKTLIVFSAVGWLALFLILRTQTLHPFNPQGFHSAPWDVTFNTVSSFVTNTNWQFYGGETTMTYFSQMAGLAVQNFLSAAVGIVVVVALIRAIAARRGQGEDGSLGNFWQDLIRTILYVLLPISVIGAADPRLPGHAADAGALRDLLGAGRRVGARSPWGRWPARRSSRSSAPTAAASSTSTRRCRSRTRRSSRTSWSCSRSC